MTARCFGFPLRDKLVIAKNLALANIYLTLEMTEGCDHRTLQRRDPARNRDEKNMRSAKPRQAACDCPAGILTLSCYGMNRQRNDEGRVSTAVNFFVDRTHANAQQYTVSKRDFPTSGRHLRANPLCED